MRADSGMTSIQPKASAEMRHLVHFEVAGQAYALDIRDIQEIIYFRSLTPIPQAADYILGVIELRGQIVPVVSLSRRLGTQDGNPRHAAAGRPDGDHILIARISGRVAGLLVDGVKEVIRVQTASIHGPEGVMVSGNHRYLDGVFDLNGRLILILNPGKLLTLDDLNTADCS